MSQIIVCPHHHHLSVIFVHAPVNERRYDSGQQTQMAGIFCSSWEIMAEHDKEIPGTDSYCAGAALILQTVLHEVALEALARTARRSHMSSGCSVFMTLLQRWVFGVLHALV
jgi:hypothetical protein